MSDASLDAMSNFLALGLRHYAVDLPLNDREYAIATALYDLAAQPKAPGDDIPLCQGDADPLAQWWACLAFAPPKTTANSTSTVMWKEAKNPNNFISWARLCQRHREEVAKKRRAASVAEQGVPAASAAEQGMPGSLPSWRGG